MSKAPLAKDQKSSSAPPPPGQESGMLRMKGSSAGNSVSGIVHTSSSPLPTTPGHDPKSDSDLTMTRSTPPTPVSNAKKPPPPPPQFISHLPRAEQEALSVFAEISDNHYQYGTLGRSREALESMTCDCQYEPRADKPTDACGHDSDCINRLTQVECLPDDCRCRSYCQNQRFQRKQHADIEIVQTEKKGFGLRAATDLRKDTFIYEYVGEVVSHPSFQKRMREYAQEGIRHFYFMMLQKDEFIDATKRGGIGRFANHSCNPNCYVAKWTVGQHVRMGIFANRFIKKDEELTFNYNVDRYGHEAQPCYCGEPNCVGFIGGKTQTDLAAMDDLYLDALGIADEVDRLGLKGTKKKRGKKLDDPDFAPTLKPLVEKDVPKVVQAIRQTQSRKVLCKLLTRIKITEDQPALRQIMRLRGFSLMTNILEDYVSDLEIVITALECMTSWPLLQRNKVDDSKITIPVKTCAESENETVKTLAQKLLDYWDTLSSAYRIPKRTISDGDDELPTPTGGPTSENADSDIQVQKRSRYEDEPSLGIRPIGLSDGAIFFDGSLEFGMKFKQTRGVTAKEHEELSSKLREQQINREKVATLIAAVKAAATAANGNDAKPQPSPAVVEEKVSRKESKSPKKHQSKEEKEKNKEKRLMKLVGVVVVKCMSKHQKEMDHDLFKKHAKELTQIIAEKEKKSSSYREGRLDSLSDDKVMKIKIFSKEYIHKILRKLESSGKRRRPPSTPSTTLATSSTTVTTPDSREHGVDGVTPGMSVEEEDMDMDPKSESEDEEMMNVNGNDDAGDGDGDGDEDGDGDGDGPSFHLAADDSPLDDLNMSPDPMDLLARPGATSDPRRRLPSEDGWGPDKITFLGVKVGSDAWS